MQTDRQRERLRCWIWINDGEKEDSDQLQEEQKVKGEKKVEEGNGFWSICRGKKVAKTYKINVHKWQEPVVNFLWPRLLKANSSLFQVNVCLVQFLIFFLPTSPNLCSHIHTHWIASLYPGTRTCTFAYFREREGRRQREREKEWKLQRRIYKIIHEEKNKQW